MTQPAALLHIGLDDDLQSELAGDIRHEIIEDGVLISTCGGLEVHLSVADRTKTSCLRAEPERT